MMLSPREMGPLRFGVALAAALGGFAGGLLAAYGANMGPVAGGFFVLLFAAVGYWAIAYRD